MKYNPEIHHRKSMRLKHYDYAEMGAYFVTICTHDRVCLFGEVVDREMVLNAAGEMVKNYWMDIAKRFEGVERDEFIVMPNHFHGILFLVGADRCVCPDMVDEQNPKTGRHIGLPLPTIIQWFKTMTTNEYIRNVKHANWPAFCGRLWQRNYYEHIIRDESELNRIREYVINNPVAWDKDEENPAVTNNVGL